MIDIWPKIHDSLTLEFKLRFRADKHRRINTFFLNTWIFVPSSLDIRSGKYSREDFYKDIHTHIRLITPVFELEQIAAGEAKPIKKLEEAIEKLASDANEYNLAEYEYQIKMFAAIYKSAVRDKIFDIFEKKDIDLAKEIDQLITQIDYILKSYRNFERLITEAGIDQREIDYFLFGDEFMCNLTEKECFGILKRLEQKQGLVLAEECNDLIISFLEKTKKHKISRNFTLVEPNSSTKNSEFIFRMGALKKYIESELFLNARKKRDGVIIEQIYYSLAAGLSMIFATSIAFSFQIKYGNFTMPLFVALVVSYMLKDRIKELIRYYFAHKHSAKYFDNKTTISVKNREIGWSKESFDFVAESKIPDSVVRSRNRIPLIEADNRHSKENIILFRKSAQLDTLKLSESSNYDVQGITEIIRINLSSFMKKTDNPELPLFILDENNNVKQILGTKNYFLNVVFQHREEKQEILKRYRIGFNRNGIFSLQSMPIL